jgi:hypothetical protein
LARSIGDVDLEAAHREGDELQDGGHEHEGAAPGGFDGRRSSKDPFFDLFSD